MKRFSRRQFIQLTGGLAMASILPRPQLSMAGMWAKLFGEPKRDIAPITPNDEFYITSYRTPPFLPAEQWALSVRGLVKRPFTLTYPQLDCSALCFKDCDIGMRG